MNGGRQGSGPSAGCIVAMVVASLCVGAAFFLLFFTISSTTTNNLIGPKPLDSVIFTDRQLLGALKQDQEFTRWFEGQRGDRSAQGACLVTETPLDLQTLTVKGGKLKSISVSSLPGSGIFYNVFYDGPSETTAQLSDGKGQSFKVTYSDDLGCYIGTEKDLTSFASHWANVRLGAVTTGTGFPEVGDPSKAWTQMVQFEPGGKIVSAWADADVQSSPVFHPGDLNR